MKAPILWGKGIIVGAVRLGLPADLDHARWCEIGTNLCHLERALAWWVGDWWAFGEHCYGARREITEHPAGGDRRIRPAPMLPQFAGRSRFPAGHRDTCDDDLPPCGCAAADRRSMGDPLLLVERSSTRCGGTARVPVFGAAQSRSRSNSLTFSGSREAAPVRCRSGREANSNSSATPC